MVRRKPPARIYKTRSKNRNAEVPLQLDSTTLDGKQFSRIIFQTWYKICCSGFGYCKVWSANILETNLALFSKAIRKWPFNEGGHFIWKWLAKWLSKWFKWVNKYFDPFEKPRTVNLLITQKIFFFPSFAFFHFQVSHQKAVCPNQKMSPWATHVRKRMCCQVTRGVAQKLLKMRKNCRWNVESVGKHLLHLETL